MVRGIAKIGFQNYPSCIFILRNLTVLARQKEKALGSMNEVVQTVKHPRSHKDEKDYPNIDFTHLKPSEVESLHAPNRQTPRVMSTSDPYLRNSTQDSKSKFRKSQHAASME